MLELLLQPLDLVRVALAHNKIADGRRLFLVICCALLSAADLER